MNTDEALQILGLTENPGLAEVKKSYRLLALKYHPDRNPANPNAAEQFRFITEAYNFVVENAREWSDRGMPSSKTKTAPPASLRVEDTADVFDDIFGFTREDRILGYQPPQPLVLTIREQLTGGKKRVRLFSYEKCSVCRGSGSEGLRLSTICTYCFGGGRIVTGLEKKAKICPKCGGRGRQVKKACPGCDGFGRIGKKRAQEVAIPPGLATGKEYTLHSKDMKKGGRLDVFVRVELKEGSLFTVENGNVLCQNLVARFLSVLWRRLKGKK